jgi:hypothetical protein
LPAFSGSIKVPVNVSIDDPNEMLKQFRLANSGVRKTKTSEQRYRNSHANRNGRNLVLQTMPSSFASRAPLLTNKFASIDMCKQLIS